MPSYEIVLLNSMFPCLVVACQLLGVLVQQVKECQLKVAADFAEGYSMLGLSHQDANGKDQGHI